MRFVKLFAIAFCVTLLCVGITPVSRADQWDKKSIVTFNDPVQIPGQVLTPGTYVFKVFDSPANRDIVQIWNQDEDRVIATIHTIHDYQPQANDKSVFILDQSSGQSTAALESWFYAGEKSGQRFAYPKYPTNEEANNRHSAY
jgi:hypothetical protein